MPATELGEKIYSIEHVASQLFPADVCNDIVERAEQIRKELGIVLPRTSPLEELHTILLLLSACTMQDPTQITQALQDTYAMEHHPEHSHKTTKELLIVVTVVALWCLDHVDEDKLESDTDYCDRIQMIGDDLYAMTQSFSEQRLSDAKELSSKLMEELKVLFAIDPLGIGEPLFFCFDFEDIDGGKTKKEQYYPYYERAYQLMNITDRQEQYALYCTAAGSFDLRFCFTAYKTHRKKEFLYHESLHTLMPGILMRILDEAMTEWQSFRNLHFLNSNGSLPSRNTLIRKGVDRLYYRQLEALYVIFERIPHGEHLLEALYRTGESELLLEFAEKLFQTFGPQSYAMLFLADPDQYNPSRRKQPWISPGTLTQWLETTGKISS